MENNKTYLDEKTLTEYETRLKEANKRLDELLNRPFGGVFTDEDLSNEYNDLVYLCYFLEDELNKHYHPEDYEEE